MRSILIEISKTRKQVPDDLIFLAYCCGPGAPPVNWLALINKFRIFMSKEKRRPTAAAGWDPT